MCSGAIYYDTKVSISLGTPDAGSNLHFLSALYFASVGDVLILFTLVYRLYIVTFHLAQVQTIKIGSR